MHELLSVINSFFQSLGIYGLAINAGIESCLPGFPLPPDILLGAMNLANPQNSMFNAFICTIASVVGGSLGYFVGSLGGRPICEFIFKNNTDKIVMVDNMYQKYGTLAVFVSAFTPIPYNIFTIASGILRMNFLKFFFASFLGRGARFFLVSLILMYFGETVKKYMDIFILAATILIIIVFCLLIYKKKRSLSNERNNNEHN